ncbi:DUF488 domain-containing protein [Streptomyces mirabilis]|uniref:DUF488 domain-containing protein n=1 Tax=Streptomyces mirabilis TaxID=68239 RepID=UPI0036522396
MYEDTSSRNGKRVLVDRVWLRAMSKRRAHLDEWLRDVAPSADRRHWPHHDQERFAEFRDRYIGELADADHRPAVRHLRDFAAHDKVTLLTPTKDLGHSEAAVLAQWLGAAGTASRWIRCSVTRRAWRTARQQVLRPEDFAPPLGKRVYDLRHTCLTNWLNDGVPPTRVTDWANSSRAPAPHTHYRGLSDPALRVRPRPCQSPAGGRNHYSLRAGRGPQQHDLLQHCGRLPVRVRRSDLDLRGVHPVSCDGGHQCRVVPYGEFVAEQFLLPVKEPPNIDLQAGGGVDRRQRLGDGRRSRADADGGRRCGRDPRRHGSLPPAPHYGRRAHKGYSRWRNRR